MTLSPQDLLIVGIFFVRVTALLVFARLWATLRHVRQKIFLDDVAATAALFFIMANLLLCWAAFDAMSKKALGHDLMGRVGTANVIIGPFAMWTLKMPILLFLLYTFHVKRWLRIIVILTLTISAVYILVPAPVGT
ncbi:hypothetical protein BJX62DRAFT_244864 [Aspergillus germanicus]